MNCVLGKRYDSHKPEITGKWAILTKADRTAARFIVEECYIHMGRWVNARDIPLYKFWLWAYLKKDLRRKVVLRKVLFYRDRMYVVPDSEWEAS